MNCFFKRGISGLLFLSTIVSADLYDKGSKELGITVGSGSVSFGYRVNNYTILGLSGNYYLYDGLSVGLGYRGWFGANPAIHQITLPVTYFVPLSEKFRPYGGAFYRYNIIEDPFNNYHSAGLRAGVSILSGNNAYINFGWVEEFAEYDSSGYPEIAIGIAF